MVMDEARGLDSNWAGVVGEIYGSRYYLGG